MRDQDKKRKISQLRRMRYTERRRSRNWRFRKRRNRLLRLSLPVPKRRNRPRITWIPAPKIFSIIENARESLTYLSDCGELLQKGKRVGFDLRDIELMTPDMIPLLVALTFDENYNKYGLLKGNMPLKKQPRKLFYSSGFLNLVQTDEENRQEIDPSHCHLTNDLLSGEEAEGKEAANACDRIAEQTFEDTGMPVELDFYSLLVEVITNTKNHASPLAPIKWWIYTHNDTTTGNTSCTVLDLGSGIFRGHSGRVKGFVDKIFELFNRKASHQEIAKAILDGSIISSKEEDQDRRGKGLQQILNISKSRYIARAVLYSNDIKIDLQNDVSETLAIELEGTFYHFEITNPNK